MEISWPARPVVFIVGRVSLSEEETLPGTWGKMAII
jgi:hypothetical protein